MGEIATITVQDSVPADHVFTPQKIDGDTARWVNRAGGDAVGFEPLSLTVRQPLPGQPEKLYRVSLALALPQTVNETINGVTTKALSYTIRANVEFIMPQVSTKLSRENALALVTDLLSSSLVVSAVEDLENVW